MGKYDFFGCYKAKKQDFLVKIPLTFAHIIFTLFHSMIFCALLLMDVILVVLFDRGIGPQKTNFG